MRGATYDGILDVPHPFPLAVGSHDLQAAHRLAPQNGEATDVSRRSINELQNAAARVNAYLCALSAILDWSCFLRPLCEGGFVV